MTSVMSMHLRLCGLLAALLFNVSTSGLAADPAASTNQPTREQLREQLRQLTPEERQAKIREIREKLGPPGGPWRAEAERRREEWKDLSPEERRAKALEWRARRPGEQQPPVTVENRDLYRQQIRDRLQRQIQELNAKKAKDGLSAEEQKRLDNLEQVSKHFATPGGAPPAPAK
jgi:hypothetical protein